MTLGVFGNHISKDMDMHISKDIRILCLAIPYHIAGYFVCFLSSVPPFTSQIHKKDPMGRDRIGAYTVLIYVSIVW